MTRPVLITIPISHFCEKARWTLAWGGIAYEERARLQMLHWLTTIPRGAGRMVPVLLVGREVVGDSCAIMRWVDAQLPPERRLLASPGASELEAELGETLGPDGRGWMYHRLLPDRSIARRFGPTGVPRWQQAVMPALLPLMEGGLRRYYGLTDARAAAALDRVRRRFDGIAERLADGRPHLLGDAFSAADLSFASLAAAVLMPPTYSVPLPQPEDIDPDTAAVVRELRAHPAGQFALRLYGERPAIRGPAAPA